MDFDLRQHFAEFYLPPDLSIRAFIEQVHAGSLDQALQFHRDGLDAGFSIEGTIRRRVDAYFGGSTSESEEDAALELILSTRRAADIVALINNLTWDNLDDELDEQDLTRIAGHCHDRLDHRDFVLAFLLRWFYLAEADALADRTSAELTSYVAARSSAVRFEFMDRALDQHQRILDGVASRGLRGLATFTREFRLALDEPTPVPSARALDILQLSWETHYTELIARQLEKGEYAPLLAVLPEMLDPGLPARRRAALFDMLRRWDRLFAAVDALIALVGSARQSADMRRVASARSTLMNHFPGPAAAPGQLAAAIAAIIAALNAVGTSFEDMRNAVLSIAESIERISVPRLFDTASDDEAVSFINRMSQTGGLSLLPTSYKLVLIERALSGACEDEEEQAVLTVLRETRERSVAEFMQLVAGITWEKLYDAFDGTEYDELEKLFHL